MSLFFRLNDASHASPVSRLRLGEIATDLAEAGLSTLGTLLSRIEMEPRGILGIPGLNRTSAIQLTLALGTLASLIDEDGNIDWDGFHPPGRVLPSTRNAAEPPLETVFVDADKMEWVGEEGDVVPMEDPLDGQAFIESFPEVIAAIIRTRTHEADRLILTGRLARQPHERRSLEQVAAASPGSLTRERIRQRERKILDHLASALLLDRSRRLGLSFRPSFANYWKQAAEWFGQKEEVTFSNFIEGLEKAWNVPADRLFVHLPLIMSVLTRKATLPEGIRVQLKLDPRIYRKLDERVAKLPLTSLATGAATDELAKIGVENIGELFQLVRTGLGPSPSSRSGKAINRVTAAVMDAVGEDGSIDWTRYGEEMGLLFLPEQDSASGADFLSRLPHDMELIVNANANSSRALQIFKARISVPRASRLTLAGVADLLDTHGSHIKRDESILLARLHDQLVDGDFRCSRVMFSPRFLEHWADAAVFHRRCGGEFSRFCALAADRWELDGSGSGRSLEILWAILDQYPGGRPAGSRRKPRASFVAGSSRAAEGTIVLRGFRRVH